MKFGTAIDIARGANMIRKGKDDDFVIGLGTRLRDMAESFEKKDNKYTKKEAMKLSNDFIFYPHLLIQKIIGHPQLKHIDVDRINEIANYADGDCAQLYADSFKFYLTDDIREATGKFRDILFDVARF